MPTPWPQPRPLITKTGGVTAVAPAGARAGAAALPEASRAQSEAAASDERSMETPARLATDRPRFQHLLRKLHAAGERASDVVTCRPWVGRADRQSRSALHAAAASGRLDAVSRAWERASGSPCQSRRRSCRRA